MSYLFAGAEGERTAGKKSNRSARSAQADAANGKEIYQAQCAICHFSASTEIKIGPGLKGLYKRSHFTDGKKVDDIRLRAWIEKGGKQMPPFKEILSAEQIADLIAYLRAL